MIANQLICKKLKENNTKVIFEYPGGNIAPILDAVKLDGKIDLVVTRNDQAASLMADAYARATGEVGVCMATVGPGATNLISGIATAYFDSIPMVAITGQVGTAFIKGNKGTRQIGFQEADIVNMVKPVTKWAYTVKKAQNIGQVIDKAFKTAKSGRPGPVLIDLPMDVQRAMIEEVDILAWEDLKIKKTRIERSKIKTIIQQIKDTKKPVIIAGGGVILSNASNELKNFSKKLSIPVANTLMGLGSFDQQDDLFLGFMGCYGSRYCNKIIAEADFILALGNRFAIRAIGTESKNFSKNKYIVHIDIDRAEINNRVKVNLPLNCDVKEALKLLNEAVEMEKISFSNKEWLSHIKEYKEKYSLENEYGLAGSYAKVRPQCIISKISEITGGNTIVTTDVGQHQMWTAQFFKYRYPRTNLTSGGLGIMGYGLPAAIAAKYALKNKQVINITGDGSFQMNLQELATAVQYKTHVKIFIMRNNTLGLVKHFQDRNFPGKATSTEFEYNPNFVKLAETYGIKAYTIERANQIDSIVTDALKYDGTVIVECSIDADEPSIPEMEGGHYLDDQYPYGR
ncbi:MAG: biosynthetic-type acetolactate synthase large subunit [Bacillota bacterium]